MGHSSRGRGQFAVRPQARCGPGNNPGHDSGMPGQFGLRRLLLPIGFATTVPPPSPLSEHRLGLLPGNPPPLGVSPKPDFILPG